MSEMGISPNKLLGQNFLVSKSVIQKIVTAAEETKAENYIEVGPGPGALTDRLEEKSIKPKLIEMDRKIASYWESRGYSVIQGDALKQNWQDLCDSQKTCFVSNLPYQISSSIVIDRSMDRDSVSWMILMFQKEVAERILAKHGGKDYGLLSVIAQSFWEIEKLTDAGPKDFYPPPKVASRVLKFSRKKNDIDAKKLLMIVKAAFSQRRKKLTKNLKSVAQIDGKALELKLLEWGLAPTARAEELSVAHFHEIAAMVGE